MVTKWRVGLWTLVCTLALGCSTPEAPNTAPAADFVYTPVSPIDGGVTVVTFNASASQDPDGRIVTYIWDFGDGTGVQQLSGAITTHVFPDTAARCDSIVYSVLLTVEDDRGGRDSVSDQVEVIELPRPGSIECQ
jgi:PKD repeat protein